MTDSPTGLDQHTYRAGVYRVMEDFDIAGDILVRVDNLQLTRVPHWEQARVGDARRRDSGLSRSIITRS